MEPTDPAVIILNDLKLFNATAVYFEEEIWPKIHSNAIDFLAHWEKDNNWTFIADKDDSLVDSRFFPNSWNPNEQWFKISYIGKVSDAADYILADLCGFGSDKIGLTYCNNLQVRVREWKRKINVCSNEYSALLKRYSFYFDDEGLTFYTPIILDHAKLVDAWENDAYDEFLLPLTNALESAKNSLAEFDKFYEVVTKS